jgi:DNA-binding NarL/FixJ family response regulator
MQLLIVDSSAYIIQRLEEMLTDATDVSIIYTSVSYENAIRLFNANKPGVVLLCTGLPENNSLKLLTEIKSAAYKSVVIMLSVTNDEYMHKQYQLLGADCMLDKYKDFELIPDVINSIPVL